MKYLEKYQNDPRQFIVDCGWLPTCSLQDFLLREIATNKFISVYGGRATGKTWIASRLALWWMNMTGQNRNVLYIAPLVGQLYNFFNMFIEAYEEAKLNLHQITIDRSLSRAEMANGDFLKCIAIQNDADFKDTICGYCGDILIIVDDANNISKEDTDQIRFCTYHSRMIRLWQ